ncbi:MAG TPA: hypothetical protein VF832_00225 [Longimicrobiales bacterium]
MTAESSDHSGEQFVVEYYYKVRWGHQEEFLRLFRKNHLPVLLREQETGKIADFSAVAPRYHATEDGRWDYRVTISFRDAVAAMSGPLPEAELRKLFPDKETFEREEQRRFEILDAHWDLPLVALQLS